MKVLYSNHPVMFKNNPVGFIIALILIPVFGAGILILLVWYVKTRATKLTVLENEILLERGLLSKDHFEVSIGSVRTVRVKQSFFNRVFGVGTVEIYTAGDSPEIVAAGLPDPNRIKELVRLRA